MRRAAGVLLLCACVPSTQGGVRPALGSLESLRRSIDSLVANPQLRNSQIGILIVKLGSSDTLYSRNAGKLFIPASNMKIITGSVALTQLGADYRYKTAFVTRGAIRDGTLDGDLIVVGRGDPTVSDRAQQGGAKTWMGRVADSLAAHGIKRITGGLVRGGNAFPDSIYGYGWEWDDLSGSSAAPVDELEYNEGMTTVRQHIAGRDTVVETATRNPARTYLEALGSTLAERGITVGRGVSDSTADVVAPRTDTLFTVLSPPLRDILRLLMKPS
ncbi:MAG: D-alanyl-D-alanine carboxypeptidase, partial [Gemmatimonadales bacterium]